MPKIVRVAETLPTSSASLEQNFSIILLLKTDIRNSLSEESLAAKLKKKILNVCEERLSNDS